MRICTAVFPLLFLVSFTTPCFAQDTLKPEAVVEKMAFKLARGVTNIGTSIVELPKQSYITVRDRGNVGYVIGPLKGIGMGIYRLLMGGVETIFFMVPQPGYYDPIVEPEFVWNGWEEKRTEPGKGREPDQSAAAGKKGE